MLFCFGLPFWCLLKWKIFLRKCFDSNSFNILYIHRCKTARVEELYKEQLGKLLTPPTIDEVGKVKYANVVYNINGKKDIWFSGFGFVQINGNCKVKVKHLDKTEVYLTNAIIG